MRHTTSSGSNAYKLWSKHSHNCPKATNRSSDGIIMTEFRCKPSLSDSDKQRIISK